MKFEISSTKINYSSDISILAIDEKNNLLNANNLNTSDDKMIKSIIKKGDLSEADGSLLKINDGEGKNIYLLARIADVKNIDSSRLNLVFTKVAKGVSQYNPKSIQICLCFLSKVLGAEDVVMLFSRSVIHNCYKINSLKNDKSKLNLSKILIHVAKDYAAAAKKGLSIGEAVAHGANLTKDLGNLPPNVCTPTYLGDLAKKIAKESGMKVKVLGKSQIEKLKMGSFLSVAKGSREEPKFIILEHLKGKTSEKPTVLVGKGITFDAGGISLKPGANMDEMKYDMCGAATVLGVMKTIGTMKLPLNVVALIPACENLPDGIAVKPGDIVTSMSGQTIEILNTDAEGRLILCDALTYAERYKPTTVIDIATLTGACVIALGHEASAVFSNQESLARELIDAGEQSQDRAWHMPLWDEYQPLLDSNFADMANIGGRAAGSITAACFLSRFTKKYNWAHLDIAGTAWISGGKAKGGTGRPVNLLTKFLMNRLKK